MAASREDVLNVKGRGGGSPPEAAAATSAGGHRHDHSYYLVRGPLNPERTYSVQQPNTMTG